MSLDVYPYLHQIGLNRSEITVYLYLLENGYSTPPMISKGTGIARTNCYNVLDKLIMLELVELQAAGKRKAYVAIDPAALLRTLEKKKDAIANIVPDLRALYVTQKNKPKIRFYEGVEQIQQVYRQSLEAKKIVAIGSTSQLNKLMEDFLGEYQAEIKKRGIEFHDILTNSSRTIAMGWKQDLASFYNVKFLPQKFQDPPTDILLWDNHIALLTLEEPIFGTVLTSPMLAKTFEMLAEILWEKL